MTDKKYRLVAQAWQGNNVIEFILNYETVEELYTAYGLVLKGLHLTNAIIVQSNIDGRWVDLPWESGTHG